MTCVTPFESIIARLCSLTPCAIKKKRRNSGPKKHVSEPHPNGIHTLLGLQSHKRESYPYSKGLAGEMFKLRPPLGSVMLSQQMRKPSPKFGYKNWPTLHFHEVQSKKSPDGYRDPDFLYASSNYFRPIHALCSVASHISIVQNVNMDHGSI